MRYYLIDSEQNELIMDLTHTRVHSSELVEYEFSTLKDNEYTLRETIFVRKLAGQYYSSTDNRHWRKLARQELPKKILNVDRVYDLYRGYKPSGLSSAGSGELLTQMPGKVVKIMVVEGEEVKKGDTLIVLEAMKMENEIKCGVDGTVKQIHVQEGQALEQGVLMMEVES